MDKYNNLMMGYKNAAPYPEEINSYLSTNDFNTITQIVNVLNQISPLDAGIIESEQERIHTYEQSDRFKKRHKPFKSLY